MANYLPELNLAKKVATSASDIIQKYQRESNYSINFKGKNDIVTEADVETEEHILSAIRRAYPEDHIMAEETAQRNEMPENRTWIVDPIDGTTNFAHGFPIYCVSIGLWENRKPKMGLVLEVSSDEYFTALAGKGAFLNGNPITVSKRVNPENALVGTGFPYNDLSMVDNYIRFFRMLMDSIQGVRRPGAASYDLCCVACGRFDGFYEYALNPWDVGAAALIVQEAGGKVTDWTGGADWLFGERIVAGNPEMHKFLLNEIANYFEEDEVKSKHEKRKGKGEETN